MSEDRADGEMFIVVAVNLPTMLLRLFRSYLRMRRQAKDAGRYFYRSLVDNGVPPSMAKDLCHEYTSALSLTTILREMGQR